MNKSIIQISIFSLFLVACGFPGPSDEKVELDATEFMEKKMEGLIDFTIKVKEREMLSEDRAKYIVEFIAVRNQKKPTREEQLAARMFNNRVLLEIYNTPRGTGTGEVNEGTVIFRKENNTWFVDSFD